MSVCPTCGHCSEDELVHSTPEPGDGVRLPPDSQWHRDLAQLVSLVRTAVAQHSGPFMTPFHVDKRRRASERSKLKKTEQLQRVA